ncbi:MAG: histidine kinase, partial [Bacteroidales bacterium]|nr:histidine kinase [Bacteroidales bacterium]
MPIFSHEIRTPMNSILGFTEILMKSIKKDEYKRKMKVIYQSGNQLINLINDIMDISKLEAGEIRITKSIFNLNETMVQVQEQFEGIHLSHENH